MHGLPIFGNFGGKKSTKNEEKRGTPAMKTKMITTAKKAVSMLLVLTLFAGLLPLTALAVEDKWKFMMLESPDQTVLSHSNYSVRTADVYFPFQPVITDAGGEEEVVSATLSFSVQFDQPFRIEVWELKEEYKLSAPGGSSSVSSSPDPRAPDGFMGYLFGSYDDELVGQQEPRAFDGDMGSAQPQPPTAGHSMQTTLISTHRYWSATR